MKIAVGEWFNWLVSTTSYWSPMTSTTSSIMTSHQLGYFPLTKSDPLYYIIMSGAFKFFFLHRSDPDYSGNAVSNGTFSKIFGPGMRLGWMEAPARVRDTVLSSGLCNSGGGFNHTASGIMTSVIELGTIESLLEQARPMYQVCLTL